MNINPRMLNLGQKNIAALARLASGRDNLRRSERKVLEFILGNPLEVTEMTITQLAEGAGCSESSIVRMCQALGFNGFMDLKFWIRSGVEDALSQDYDEVSSDDNTSDLIGKVFHASARAIEDTAKLVDTANIQKAVEVLLNANPIAFFGQGGAASVCLDAYFKFINIQKPCIWQQDSNIQLIIASTLGPGSVGIAISRSGAIKDVVDAVKLTRDGGGYTIAITGTPDSPLAKAADVVLYCHTNTGIFRNVDIAYRLGELAILDVLYVAVANNDTAKTTQALRRTALATSLKKIGKPEESGAKEKQDRRK